MLNPLVPMLGITVKAILARPAPRTVCAELILPMGITFCIYRHAAVDFAAELGLI